MLDIVVLHDIVALAQEDLQEASSPKPLPAAALFKAYDEVLPHYGIDPDDDHHLSSFVFRVGGEEGSATLLEKFQAILGHMGITVERGDQDEHDIQASPARSAAVSLRSAYNRALRLLPREAPKTSSRAPYLDAAFQSTSQSLKTPRPRLEDPKSPPILRRQLYGQDEDISQEPLSVAQKSLVENNDIELKQVSMAPMPVQSHDIPPQLQANVKRWIEAAKDRDHVTQVSFDGDRSTARYEAQTPERLVESRVSVLSQRMLEQAARPPNPSPPSLLSILGSWQNEAKLPPTIKTLPFRPGPGVPGWENAHEAAALDYSGAHITSTHGHSHAPQALMGRMSEPGEGNYHQVTHATPKSKENVTGRLGEELMVSRLTRARQIYLASKFFNHWADRTARRLEREAVARRHMMRFRCFRGWTQMPSSRDSIVEQMMVATAAKKLRNATERRATQLDSTEQIGAQAYRKMSALRALERWQYRLNARKLQATAAERFTSRALFNWKQFGDTQASIISRGHSHHRDYAKLEALVIWREQASKAGVRLDAAHDIGSAYRGQRCLRDWWDISELNRRAKTYRDYMLAERTTHAVTIWNLAARAQASQWSHDYKTVSSTFDGWHDMAAHGRATAAFIKKRKRQHLAKSMFACLQQQQQGVERMDRLQNRARLYITATKTMDLLQKVYLRRKQGEKERLKKYLMARYKQVSSARKRRQFFGALSIWQQAAVAAQRRQNAATEFQAASDSQRMVQVSFIWSDKASRHSHRMKQATQQRSTSWLEAWMTWSLHEAQQEEFGWTTWAIREQHNALKDWTIMSLQRSGHAHTAGVIHQKHRRDRRQRILQSWKRRAITADEIGATSIMGLTPQPASMRMFRRSLRSLSERQMLDTGHSSRMSSSMDTPGRWTAQSSLASSTMGQNPMPSVDEAEEPNPSIWLRTEENRNDVESPTRIPPNFNVFGATTSTTPRVPIPSHLAEGFKPQTPARHAGSRTPAWPRSALRPPSQLFPGLRQSRARESFQQRIQGPLGHDNHISGRKSERTFKTGMASSSDQQAFAVLRNTSTPLGPGTFRHDGIPRSH